MVYILLYYDISLAFNYLSCLQLFLSDSIIQKNRPRDFYNMFNILLVSKIYITPITKQIKSK